MLLHFLAKLLFHYKRGGFLRRPNVDCPTRSAMAIIMDHLDTCILPNTFIDF